MARPIKPQQNTSEPPSRVTYQGPAEAHQGVAGTVIARLAHHPIDLIPVRWDTGTVTLEHPHHLDVLTPTSA